MKLYLDDSRNCPEGYILFRPEDLDEFYSLAASKSCEIISFDHDLGDNFPTGYDILVRLEKMVYDGMLWEGGAPILMVHSSNPVGSERMGKAIASIYRMVGVR